MRVSQVPTDTGGLHASLDWHQGQGGLKGAIRLTRPKTGVVLRARGLITKMEDDLTLQTLMAAAHLRSA